MQLGGQDREYLVTSARMHWEHSVSSLYSPVQLGEIIQKRSFSAPGDVNPLSKQPKKTSLELSDENTSVAADETTWSPRSILAVLDGMNSSCWAMILCSGERRSASMNQ